MEKIEKTLAFAALPARPHGGNKGSFGKALLLVGSKAYPGAAHLAAEAALRGGAGYVTVCGDAVLLSELRMKFPELLFLPIASPSDFDALMSREKYTAALFGPGAGNTSETKECALALLAADGGTLVLDADALNALSTLGDRGEAALRGARRPVVITPHPLEFARLSGLSLSEIATDRAGVAAAYAKRCHLTLVLKGEGTVVTDGERVFENTTGSVALAKAGSGDVLAGFLTSLAASGASPLSAAISAVYFHGAAGDALEKKYSSRGVTPSDLPKEIARQMAKGAKHS